MVFFSFCVVFIWVPMLSKVPEEPSNLQLHLASLSIKLGKGLHIKHMLNIVVFLGRTLMTTAGGMCLGHEGQNGRLSELRGLCGRQKTAEFTGVFV